MKRITLLVLISILLTATACSGNATQVAPLEAEDLQTLVAGTLTAAAVELGQTMTAAVTATFTPTITFTATLPPTQAPTTAPVTLTTNGNVHCRKGASTTFPSITIIPAGTVVEVIARNPGNDFFYVRAAESETGACWIWGQYASLNGDSNTLPVFTPVPTPLPTATNTPPPTAVFTAQYIGYTTCPTALGSKLAANFLITNTGALTLQSVRIKSNDLIEHSSNSFRYWSSGVLNSVKSEIAKGDSMTVSTCEPGGFKSNAVGSEVTAEITICTLDDLKGACGTQTVVFKP